MLKSFIIIMSTLLEAEIEALVNSGLTNDTVKLHIVTCGLSGPPGTGRGHLRTRMIGKRQSRICCSPAAVATEVDHITPDSMKIYRTVLNSTVTKKPGKSIYKWASVGSEDMARFSANSLYSNMENKENCYSEFSNQENSGTIVDDIKKLLREMKCKKKGKGLNEARLVFFIDVDGKAQFQEILPNFIKCDVNLLIHNLEQDLEHCPEFSYVFENEIFMVPEQVQASGIDIIEQSVRSICSNNTLQSERKPQVAIVGTLRDRHTPDSTKHKKMLAEKSSKINASLRKYIGSDTTKCELLAASREQIIFVIDTSADGWDTNELKRRIHEYADRNYVKVPIKYCILIHLLVDCAENFVTLKQCESLAKKGGILMRLGDIEEAVKLFCDYNIILYYPEILPGIVFNKPSYLYRLTTDLIEASFQSKHSIFNRDFQRTGVFKHHLLSRISSFETLDERFTKQDFLKLLKGLFIVAEVHPGGFFMPCVLSVTEPASKVIEQIKECMQSNCVHGWSLMHIIYT